MGKQWNTQYHKLKSIEFGLTHGFLGHIWAYESYHFGSSYILSVLIKSTFRGALRCWTPQRNPRQSLKTTASPQNWQDDLRFPEDVPSESSVSNKTCGIFWRCSIAPFISFYIGIYVVLEMVSLQNPIRFKSPLFPSHHHPSTSAPKPRVSQRQTQGRGAAIPPLRVDRWGTEETAVGTAVARKPWGESHVELIWLVLGLNPSEKYEFVNWDDELFQYIPIYGLNPSEKIWVRQLGWWIRFPILMGK